MTLSKDTAMNIARVLSEALPYIQRFTDKTPGYILSRTAATPLMAFYARPANMSHFYNRLHLQ